jgi:hypothetical protein
MAHSPTLFREGGEICKVALLLFQAEIERVFATARVSGLCSYHAIHDAVSRCSPRTPPRILRVLATSSTT